MDTLLTWVICAVGLCGAELAYWLPLKKRRNFTMRTALNFISAVPFAQVIIWANSGHAKSAMLLVIYCGVNPSLHAAGLVGQRILQHLDRPDDGVGL